MRKHITIVFLAAVVTSSPGLAVQSRPDFSGSWTLVVDAPSPPTGVRGRRGSATAGSARPPSIVSGAVVNCGEACTIVQTDKSLRVSRPPDGSGSKPADTVVNFDGSQMPGRATVTWDGATLVIVRPITGLLSVTQTLSIQNGRMVVVSEFSSGSVGPVTLQYAKKTG